MYTGSKIWKLSSQVLLLLILVSYTVGCVNRNTPVPAEPTPSPETTETTEPTMEPTVVPTQVPPRSENCQSGLFPVINTEIDPASGSGYIPNQIVFTGLPWDIDRVVELFNEQHPEVPGGVIGDEPGTPGAPRQFLWDVNGLLPDSTAVSGYTIRLYQLHMWDAADAIEEAADIALNGDPASVPPGLKLVAVPEYNFITRPPADLGGNPATGSDGIEGGPSSGSSGIEGGPGGPSSAALRGYFATQWAFLGKNPDGPVGINLIKSYGTDSNPSYFYVQDETGYGVNVAVFDSTPLGSGYFIPQDSSRMVDDPYPLYLCVTALLDDVNSVVADPVLFKDIEHGYFDSSLIQKVATQADVHLLQVLDNDLRGNLVTLLDAMNQYLTIYKQYYPERIHHILNLSLGFEWSSIEDLEPGSQQAVAMEKVQQLIDGLREQQEYRFLEPSPVTTSELPFVALRTYLQQVGELGHLVVAAVGNRGNPNNVDAHPDALEPASLPAVLGVRSTNYMGQPSCFSNSGDVGAPSGDGPISCDVDLESQCDGALPCKDAIIGRVYGAYPSGYAYWTGTSFAAPLASGLAALIWEDHDELTPGAVKKLIESCMDYGVIDVGKTLDALNAAPVGELNPTCSN